MRALQVRDEAGEQAQVDRAGRGELDLAGRRAGAGERELGVRAAQHELLHVDAAVAHGEHDRAHGLDPEVRVPRLDGVEPHAHPRGVEVLELALRARLAARLRLEPGGRAARHELRRDFVGVARHHRDIHGLEPFIGRHQHDRPPIAREDGFGGDRRL